MRVLEEVMKLLCPFCQSALDQFVATNKGEGYLICSRGPHMVTTGEGRMGVLLEGWKIREVEGAR